MLNGPCFADSSCLGSLICQQGICVSGLPTGGTGGTGGTSGTGGTGGSGGTGGDGATGGTGGVGATGGTGGAGGDDTALFVPDIPTTYTGQFLDPGVEIIAHSIGEGNFGPAWLMAIRNTSADIRLCAGSMNFTYLDSSGTELGNGFGGIDAPTARLNGGTQGAGSCLLPGDIGMVADTTGLSSVDPASVAEVTWTISGVNIIDAVAMDILPATNLQVVDDGFGNKVVTGTITNLTSDTFTSVDVAVYAVTSVGRPVAAGSDLIGSSLIAGGSVSFETDGTFDVPFANLVAFTRGSD